MSPPVSAISAKAQVGSASALPELPQQARHGQLRRDPGEQPSHGNRPRCHPSRTGVRWDGQVLGGGSLQLPACYLLSQEQTVPCSGSRPSLRKDKPRCKGAGPKQKAPGTLHTAAGPRQMSEPNRGCGLPSTHSPGHASSGARPPASGRAGAERGREGAGARDCQAGRHRAQPGPAQEQPGGDSCPQVPS